MWLSGPDYLPLLDRGMEKCQLVPHPDWKFGSNSGGLDFVSLASRSVLDAAVAVEGLALRFGRSQNGRK